MRNGGDSRPKRSALPRHSLAAASFAFLLVASGGANASPWARADGALLVISRAEYFTADLAPLETEAGAIDSRFQRVESNTYLEYGLTTDITIGGKVLYGTSWITRGNTSETSSGISELEGFAQYQMLRSEKHALSFKAAAARAPRRGAGVRTGQQSKGMDGELTALYGRNIIQEPVKIFAAAEVGFRKRFSDAADQIRTQATIGVTPGDRWLLLLEGFSTTSLNNERNLGADFDIIKIQPSVTYRFSRRWVMQAGVNKEVAGRNLALGRTVFFGLWSEF